MSYPILPQKNSAETRSNALLSVEHLTVQLPRGADRMHAIHDISFDIQQGEVVCVVGESGSGKSVSANAIMGLLPDYMKPQSGRIVFEGRDLLQETEAALQALRGQKIGMIFQEPMSALTPTMKVGDQIAEVMAIHHALTPRERRQRVLDLLDYVGLPDPKALQSAYPFRLSGGQRQRIMIAMALALEPSLLIADEPTTALDVTTQAQILELIQKIQASMGMGVMFITHDFGVVSDIADRIVVMEKGELVESGPALQLLDTPSHPYTQKLIAAVPSWQAQSAAPLPAATSEEKTPLLDVRAICKQYRTSAGLLTRKRSVTAVDGVSFSVQAGETLGIVGESGSGKSSVAKCLMKLQDIEAGELWFDGRDIARLSSQQFRPLRASIQMIFQDPFASLNPRHTIGKILTDGPVEQGITRQESLKKASTLLEKVGLQPEAIARYPNEFSGGQRQRIGIARALMLEPKLLVADESVSALDVSIQAQVLELLQTLQRDLGLGMVFITHDLRVASQICDRIVVMHQGKIVETGSPEAVLDHPTHPYTQRLVNSVPGRHWETRRKAQLMQIPHR